VEEATANQGKVQMDFKHLLSRVKFRFVNDFPSTNVYLKVKDVVIKDASSKAVLATVNLTTEQYAQGNFDWSLPKDGGSTFYLGFPIVIPAGYPDPEGRFSGGGGANSSMDTEHKYFIPFAETKQYTMSLVIEMYNLDRNTYTFTLAETYEHPSIKLPEMKFDSNNSYTFITHINADNVSPDGKLNPIEFTATITDWEDWAADTNGDGKPDNEHDIVPDEDTGN